MTRMKVPAFEIRTQAGDSFGVFVPDSTWHKLFAAMAMHGILGARKGFMTDCGTDNAPMWAVQAADALIAELEKTNES